jgi:predicted HTH transcriptional regulator
VGDAQDVAADIAAMANTRGGILIYGVKETRTTSGASEICHVAITDAAMRAFRSKLYARLNPTVAGLVIQCFPPSATEGFLVVQIPESPDAPHVVGTKKSLGVPYRVGTQTEWMSEWEIERAYRDRFARCVTDSAHLDEASPH